MAAIPLGSRQVIAGLDIGAEHVRLAVIRASSAGLLLTGYARADVPIGAVVEGEIVDVEAVAASIRELVRTSGLHPRDCAIGISNQKVVVRLIDLPYMERAELQGAIQYQAQDYIPIPIEDAILDFQIIGDYVTSSNEHMMEVLLVAAQRDMVDAAVRAVDESGLKLQQIDVTSFAIVRAVTGAVPKVLPDAGEDDGAPVAVIHIASGLTNIAVVERGVPRFTRVSSLAGHQFTQAIAGALNVTFDEAEDLMLRIGLPDMQQPETGDHQSAGVDPARAQVAQDALEREVSKFIAEVRRSLDYYLTQATQSRTISRILLTGSGAQLKHLASYLENGLRAEVRLADPTSWLQVSPQCAEAVSADRFGCVAAVGLAMGGLPT